MASEIQRSSPSAQSHYSAFKQDLRKDFRYSCAYCTCAENELHAKSFEIEHYLPQKHFPGLANYFLNLLWSCEVCNKNKSDYYPGKNPQKKMRHFFRPDRYFFEDHFEVQGDLISGKTENIGVFTEKVLCLNSKRLKTLRTIRRGHDELKDKMKFGIHSLVKMLKTSKIDKGIIFRQLENLKQIHSTFDAAMNELACKLCSAYEQDEDPDSTTQKAERKRVLTEE